jgi:hypothetical protein
MKLSDWAKKQGISYLTAYRWFKDGKLPVQAYQSDSGTIIVQDDSDTLEQPMATSQSNDVMSLFLKKTVEFSKNESSIEDFAAFIISNFSLKLNNANEPSPKYSKNKPKTEDIQKHFQKFIPEKNSIDHLKMVKSLIKDNSNGDGVKFVDQNELDKAFMNDSDLLKMTSLSEEDALAELNTLFGKEKDVEGVAARNVEFVSTPQQTNYTDSTVATSFGSNLPIQGAASCAYFGAISTADSVSPVMNSTVLNSSLNLNDRRAFSAQPAAASAPKRRGRKPFKKPESSQ